MRKYMIALFAALIPAFLSAPAYASSAEDIVQPDTGNYIPIFAAMDDLVDVIGQVWAVMTSNPLFLTFLGASLFGIGIWIFKKVKRAAKG